MFVLWFELAERPDMLHCPPIRAVFGRDPRSAPRRIGRYRRRRLRSACGGRPRGRGRRASRRRRWRRKFSLRLKFCRIKKLFKPADWIKIIFVGVGCLPLLNHGLSLRIR